MVVSAVASCPRNLPSQVRTGRKRTATTTYMTAKPVASVLTRARAFRIHCAICDPCDFFSPPASVCLWFALLFCDVCLQHPTLTLALPTDIADTDHHDAQSNHPFTGVAVRFISPQLSSHIRPHFVIPFCRVHASAVSLLASTPRIQRGSSSSRCEGSAHQWTANTWP